MSKNYSYLLHVLRKLHKAFRKAVTANKKFLENKLIFTQKKKKNKGSAPLHSNSDSDLKLVVLHMFK